MNKICLFFFMCFIAVGIAQDDKKKTTEKDLKSSLDLTWEANQELSENEFVKAEADYRRAISKSDENVIAPYNLGTAYYKKESLEEAFGRFKQAGELAEAKPEKHKAFHNMGNVFMKNEEYDKAVEAYKEALRNNPEDEETRYNLALAKALAEQQKNQDKDGDKDEDAKEDEDSENKGKKEQEDQQQDNKEKDGGEQEEDENKDGDGNEKKDQPNKGQKPDEQKQPRSSQLSPQQIKNLLEAMQNEENKVQEKMNEKKVKGPKSKNAKDW
ncbi:MAG: tetratricopeptide repeat protein [Flavobacteriaceae bacterium]|nr:tetratricopeptide repeat protein [Muriicola sp.]NNK19913.1 tetratricopeptide repeat protein [Flavobacteriaceae bacterium]NNL38658.1 tetratricopeptide repeat protein [Flavobacteriaceae bacterium]